ncbi:hypothetical protein TNCV_1894951 [Trichonephila clavipes]|nr:hypothetical protein TNCV_1894951 [Trichonephila clavipes]
MSTRLQILLNFLGNLPSKLLVMFLMMHFLSILRAAGMKTVIIYGRGIYIKSQKYSSPTKLETLRVALSFVMKSLLLIKALQRQSQLLVRAASRYYLAVVEPSNIFVTDIRQIADDLAKDGAAQPTRNSIPFTYSELHSTYINNKRSTIPPAHHWCSACQVSPELILDCLGLTKSDLHEDPQMVLDFS